MAKTLKEFCAEIEKLPLRITNGQKGITVQQTDRNKLNTALTNFLYDYLKADYEFIYRGKDGVLIELSNQSIADNLDTDIGSGAITATISVKINGLDTVAADEEENYKIELEDKKIKAEKKAKTKADKIALDKKEREKK